MTGAQTENAREAKAVLVRGTACQQTRVALTQSTFRFITVYEAGQICGLLGCSDLVCQRVDLEGDSFPDREPVQFLQYRRDVFVSTTADYQASQCVLS